MAPHSAACKPRLQLIRQPRCTYPANGLLVGAMVQQQAHHLQVTVLGCNDQRGLTILQRGCYRVVGGLKTGLIQTSSLLLPHVQLNAQGAPLRLISLHAHMGADEGLSYCAAKGSTGNP
jgi:hypothetical protein